MAKRRVNRIPANELITPTEHEEGELDPFDPDAGEMGRFRLQADGEDGAAHRRGVQHDPEDQRHDQEDADRVGELGVSNREYPDLGSDSGEPGDRPGSQDDFGDTPVQGERPDGHRDRRAASAW